VVYTQTKTKQMQSKLCKGLGTSPIKDLQPIPQISMETLSASTKMCQK